MENLFGIIITACGLYCLYGFYVVKVKRELPKGILLPKDTDVKKCRDLEGYCKEAQMPLLLLGIVAVAQGIVDIYNTSVGGIDTVYFALFIISIAVLLWFAVKIRNMNKKYFGL